MTAILTPLNSQLCSKIKGISGHRCAGLKDYVEPRMLEEEADARIIKVIWPGRKLRGEGSRKSIIALWLELDDAPVGKHIQSSPDSSCPWK